MPTLVLTALDFIAKHWKAFALALLALMAAGYVGITRMTIAHLRSEIVGYKDANAKILAANRVEHTAVQTLLKLNADNQKVCTAAESAARQNLTIAQHEATAAKARAANYGSILHAIQSAPPDPTPVSPVVRDAVDRLWDAEDGH